MNESKLVVARKADNSELYEKMINEIQDYAIIIMNTGGIIQNWNKGAEKIKRYTEDEIVGKHFSIFYLQEDLDTNLPERLITEAAEKGRAAQEGWRKRKDGTRFWASVTITAIHDDDNIVVGFCKVTRDLTDRKLAEDQLKASEERYHRMIAEVQDYAIILLDENGIVENWNAGAENIKGYTSGEAIGKSFEMFYTPEDRKDGLPKRLLNLAREKGKALQEGWRVRKDGTRFWGTIVITALHNTEGKIIGFSKVTRDLTLQKIADDKLIAYNAQLEAQNSELEQFAYVASHDLQEPLRKIQTFAEIISENYDDKEFVSRYFEKLKSSARRMTELIKSLLEYSHLSTDKDNEEPADSKVNLNDIVNEVKQDFELLIEEKKATINSGPLPAVRGNHIQLRQLFSNIISNSLKFCMENPIIRISSAVVQRDQVPNAPKSLPDGNYYELVFEDNGIGFEEQYSKVIFSLFQRLHGKQDYAGTGIGLALCKKIVENHNGFITATSELGKGAKFTIFLPC